MPHWRYLILVLVSAFSPFSLGWSSNGHIVIVDSALDRLPVEVQRYYSAMLGELKTDQRKTLLNSKRSSKVKTKLALIADWPDRIRDKKLGTLFNEYNRNLPSALKQYRDAKTGTWHYDNQFYYDPQYFNHKDSSNSRCDIVNHGRLIKALHDLDRAYDASRDDLSRVLILSFIIHLIGDAHQPMHSVSRVNQRCQHDRGGNKVCVEKGLWGRCKNNLHRLWDVGFGVFNQQEYLKRIYLGASDWRKPMAMEAENKFNPSEWLDESFSYATRVYGYEIDGQKPLYEEAENRLSEGYRLMAQKIVLDRAVLASIRIQQYLMMKYKNE